ncbi:MAG: zinc ribbon domain-containing protein [Roseiarcus sp.]
MAEERRCPRCGAVNAPEGKFCSNCGAPLDAAAAPQAAPPPQSAPPPAGGGYTGGSSSSGFGASSGSGTSRTVTLAMDPVQAFAAFQQAGAALGIMVSDENPPNRIKFTAPYKDTWTTLGIAVKLDCEVQIAADAHGGSRAMVTTGLNVGSAILVFVIYVVIGLLIFGYGLILGIAADAWVYYKLNGEVSEKLGRSLIERVTGAPR